MKVEEETDAQGVFVVLTYEGEEYYHSIPSTLCVALPGKTSSQDKSTFRGQLFTTL